MRYEVPPTAGLPLRLTDLWRRGAVSFAAALSEVLGVPDPQIECSGTACLIIALSALREGSSRRTIIIPAYTCPLVPLAIAHCGLKVRLCDNAPGHFDFDMNRLQALCDSDTLAVVPTHLAGRVADVKAAKRCADNVGAWVVEDAAQALGATSDGISVGMLGDIGFFSLAVGKGLSLFEGGVLVARDAQMRAALRRVADRMIQSDLPREILRSVQLLGYGALYRPRLLAWVYGSPLRRALAHGDWVAAAADQCSGDIPLHRIGAWRQLVGAQALTRLRTFQSELATRAASRVEQLKSIDGVSVLGDWLGAVGTWPLLVVWFESPLVRHAILTSLWPAGVGVGVLFARPLTDYAFLRSIVPSDSVPRACDFAARTITISNSAWLDNARFERIVRGIRQLDAGDRPHAEAC